MEVYLIRHTTPGIEKGICYGQSDILLNMDLFDEESEQILTKVPMHFDRVYSSPLNRCLTLAQTLSPDVIQDELLMEMHFGDWEMQLWKDIPAEPLNKWMKDFVHEHVPGGENYLNLHQRSAQFLNKLLEKDVKTVGIVTHAGNIRSMISLALDLPLENSFRLNPGYGSVARLSIAPDQQLNQIHL